MGGVIHWQPAGAQNNFGKLYLALEHPSLFFMVWSLKFNYLISLNYSCS